MATPTPNTPIVVNTDGSVSMLVFLGRTLRFSVTHAGLLNPAGYKARFGLSEAYGLAPLVTADSTAGTITFTQLPASAGTRIDVEIPDEQMDLAATKGKLDLVLEEPGGAELPVFVGTWISQKPVTP